MGKGRFRLSALSASFSPEEIVRAGELKKLNQTELLKRIHRHDKIALDFSKGKGIEGVVLSYETYKALLERIAELEEELEETMIRLKYGYRADTPEEEWLEVPEGVSTMELLERKVRKKK
ncbi:MAG: hypothetical protein AB2404_15770 [Planifilum fimeticola]